MEVVQVNYFKFLLDDLEWRGVDTSDFLKTSNLRYFDLQDTDNYVPHASLCTLLDAIARYCGSEDLLKIFSHRIQWQNTDSNASLFLTMPDMYAAADCAVKNGPYNLSASRENVEIRGAKCYFRMKLVKVDYDPFVYQLFLGVTLSFMRSILGENWAPDEIHLPFNAIPHLEPYLPEGHRTKVYLNQSSLILVFPSVLLNTKLKDPNSTSYSEEYPLQSMAMRHKVETLLNAFQPGFIPTLAMLAEMLEMSIRKLQRRLREEDSSYKAILEQWRFKKSLELLGDESRQVAEISEILGYHSATNFYRSFQRWTQTTPRAYRTSL